MFYDPKLYGYLAHAVDFHSLTDVSSILPYRPLLPWGRCRLFSLFRPLASPFRDPSLFASGFVFAWVLRKTAYFSFPQSFSALFIFKKMRVPVRLSRGEMDSVSAMALPLESCHILLIRYTAFKVLLVVKHLDLN